MSSTLPSALRARFQECISEGLSSRAAAVRLKLSAATGVRWQRKLRETGSIGEYLKAWGNCILCVNLAFYCECLEPPKFYN